MMGSVQVEERALEGTVRQEWQLHQIANGCGIAAGESHCAQGDFVLGAMEPGRTLIGQRRRETGKAPSKVAQVARTANGQRERR
jgi:hypothetical protein